jgi:hypothetical protein
MAIECKWFETPPPSTEAVVSKIQLNMWHKAVIEVIIDQNPDHNNLLQIVFCFGLLFLAIVNIVIRSLSIFPPKARCALSMHPTSYCTDWDCYVLRKQKPFLNMLKICIILLLYFPSI